MRRLAPAPFVFLSAAVFCCAAHLSADDQPAVSISALKTIEAATDQQLAVDTWEILRDPLGTWLPGYGVVFTFELNLARMPAITPFNPVFTPEQRKSIHDQKIKQLVILEGVLRNSIVRTASALPTLPGSGEIVFEAVLGSQPIEDHTGLPWRVTMSANRQKILDAVANHATAAQISSLIEERKE